MVARRRPRMPTQEQIGFTFSEEGLTNRAGLGLDPTEFGFPHLLEHGLTPEEQDERIRDCVENHMKPEIDGRAIKPHLIPEMVRFIADVFYEREQQVILWKPRGGGGSLCAAILIWLMMVYRKKTIVDFAGSGEQAKAVYDYTKTLWKSKEGFEEAFLAEEPLMSMTRMKNGTNLKCCAASDKQARGKHPSGMVGDEACQADVRVGKVLKAAMNSVLSNEDYFVVLISTFHIPYGFFQQVLDNAEEMGFAVYRWDIIDTMRQCSEGMETATAKDPLALDFCRNECPLTELVERFDTDGKKMGKEYEGCDGRARHGVGHNPRSQIIKMKVMNAGGETWRVEFLCKRPKTEGPVYNADHINRCLRPASEMKIPKDALKSVGVDWGTFAAVVMAVRLEDRVIIPVAHYFLREPAETIRNFLKELRRKHGDFRVYPDAADAHGVADLMASGFDVRQVAFAKWKTMGIGSIERYFLHEHLEIGQGGEFEDGLDKLREQLLKYHTDERGKIVKEDDHLPDAMMCAMMRFLYINEFDREMEAEAARKADKGHDGGVILL